MRHHGGHLPLATRRDERGPLFLSLGVDVDLIAVAELLGRVRVAVLDGLKEAPLLGEMVRLILE